jgi:3-hydroxyacyl-[acyl-carrier-protein] dehydratase
MREKIPINKRRWVDRIIDCEEPERIMGIKNVTATEDYFNDHFPLKPVLPGVMILESLIGLSGILVERLLADQGFTDRKPLLKHSKKIKFRRFVQPGDQLVIDAKLIDFTPKISSIKAKAKVNEKTAATISIEFEHLDREEYKKNYFMF